MKKLMLLLGTLALYGCEQQPSPTAGPAPATPAAQHDANDGNSSGVDAAATDRDSKWVVDYTGDLAGTVSGGMLSVVSISSSIKIAGGGMAPDLRGQATESIQVTIHGATTDTPQAQTDLTLADGTRCVESLADRKLTDVVFVDRNKDSFHAELTGSLQCGDAKDKTIAYSATLRADP